MPNGHDLFARAKLDASGVAEGVKQAKTALTTFNKALMENKAEMKSVNSELKTLEKAQAELAQKMKESKTPTDQQKEAYQQLGTQIDALRLRAAQLKTEESDLKRKLSATTKELDGYYDQAKKSAEATQTMTGQVKTLGAALKAVLMGYTGKKLYEVLIGSNADMEQYLASFETALGSAEAAQQMARNIAAFSAKTPLELPDVSEYTKLLMNYGYASDGVLDKLRQLGDLAEGNTFKLGSVAKAYGQMYAKGKVAGEELLQMTEAGVPLLNALADTMNKTAGEVQDMVSKGLVGIPQLDAAIESLTTGTGQFAGAMEKQSTTLNGMLSTLQDNMAQIGRDMGQGAFKEVKEALAEVNGLLEEAQQNGTVAAVAGEAGEALAGIVKMVVKLLEAGYDCKELIFAAITAIAAYNAAVGVQTLWQNRVTIATKAAALAQNTYNAALNANPIGLVVAALAGLATMMAVVSTKAEEMADEWEDVQDTMNQTISNDEKEIAVIQRKMVIYDELRSKTSLTVDEKAQLAKISQELQEIMGNSVEVINRKTGAYNDLNLTLEQYIKRRRDAMKLEAMEGSYKAALTGMEEADREIEELYKKAAALTDAVIGAKKGTVHPMYQSQIDSLNQLKEQYQKTIDEYEALDVALNYTGQQMQGAAESADTLTGSVQDQADAVGKLADALSAVESAAKLYQSAVDEVSESQSLSLSTLQKIVEKYPQMEEVIYRYIGGLIDEQQVLDAMAGYYKADYDNYFSVIRAKLENNTTFYNSVLASNADMVNQFRKKYGIDLTNYSTYLEAKEALERDHIRTLLDAYNEANRNPYGFAGGGAKPAQIIAQGKKDVQAMLGALFTPAFSAAGSKYQSLVKQSVATAAGKTESSAGGTSSGSSAGADVKKELSIYEIANEAYKKLVNERIDLIEAERDAKKEALDAAIDAIDAEIEARKRLQEDRSIEKEIQSIEAQLTYAKMDDFTRMELEQQLKTLREEQAETAWQRDMADKKAALQAGYETADRSLSEMLEQLRAQLSYAGTLFGNLNSTAPTASGIVNNNSKTANVNIINQALSAAQIARAIIDQLMDGVI